MCFIFDEIDTQGRDTSDDDHWEASTIDIPYFSMTRIYHLPFAQMQIVEKMLHTGRSC